jgi:hypothetical protein
MRPSVPDVHITDGSDADFADYRPFVWQAIASVLFGLASPAAFLHYGFLFVPALGAFFGVWAIKRIGKDATGLSGCKTAWLGLSISLVFLAAAPTDAVAYRRVVADEARQFSNLWLQFLTRDEPQKAYQLTLPPQGRQPLDARLWDSYRHNLRLRADLETYTTQPAVRALLAMGAKAQVRFYQTANVAQENDGDYVSQWYAVTYEEEHERRSFFVLVSMQRVRLASGGADWRILQATVGKPEGA